MTDRLKDVLLIALVALGAVIAICLFIWAWRIPTCLAYEEIPCAKRLVCVNGGVHYCHEYREVSTCRGECKEWSK